MKRLLLISVVLFLIFGTNGHAEKSDVSDFDGHEWQGWSSLKKLAFLTGFISGSGYVVDGNNWEIEEKDYDEDKGSEIWRAVYFKKRELFNNKEVRLLLDHDHAFSNRQLSRYNIIKITNGQLSDGLDALYKDFRNRNIKLSDAIHVVKKQIEGSSEEVVEAILQWLRSDKDVNKKTYTDKDGNQGFINLP